MWLVLAFVIVYIANWYDLFLVSDKLDVKCLLADVICCIVVKWNM